MTAYETIIVERPDPRIARIVMNRPEARNAQNLQMTYDLNAAFDHAAYGQFHALRIVYGRRQQNFVMILHGDIFKRLHDFGKKWIRNLGND